MLHDFGLAVERAADRALARLYPFDVVIEQTHHRFDVARGEGCVTPLDGLFVVLL